MSAAREKADAAGFFRMQLPIELSGRALSNLAMAVLREHLARKGLGLHNDLQNEHSVIGNLPVVEMLHTWGAQEQKDALIEKLCRAEYLIGFALTEPNHGSDAAHMETTAVRDGDEWIINGSKRFNTYMHRATHDIVFARTSGEPDDGHGITAFIVPMDTPGIQADFMWWTSNMPSDHAEVSIEDCRVPHSAIVPARRTAVRGRARAQPRLQDRLGGRSPEQGGRRAHDRHGQLPRQPPGLRRGRPGDADPRRLRLHSPRTATLATCRSSTSTATTAATASRRGRRRCRCVRWPRTCSRSEPAAMQAPPELDNHALQADSET